MPASRTQHDPAALSADAAAVVNGLRALARSVATDPLETALESVAEALDSIAGFAHVALHVYRAEWDHFETVAVAGSEDAREALLGATVPAAIASDFGRWGEEIDPGVFLITGESELWLLVPHHHPDRAEFDHPDAWRTDDGLALPLADADGPLGLVSLDEPHSGRRPSPTQLALIAVIGAFAAQALATARRAAPAERDERVLSRTADAGRRLYGCGSSAELADRIAAEIVPALGFERVAVYGARPKGGLTLRARRGWNDAAELPAELDPGTVTAALALKPEQAGTWLMPAATLLGPSPAAPRSQRNGYGPYAWCDHCLVIPWRREPDDLAGVVFVEDPSDRLRPGPARRGALRLLVDLAAGVERLVDEG
jgi:hypothetical protein